MTPPAASIAISRERGAKSRRQFLDENPESSQRYRQRGWRLSPSPLTTASSGLGLMLLLGSLPKKRLETSLTIRGYEWNHRPRRIFIDVQFVDLRVAEYFSTEAGVRVLRKISWKSSSKRARVREIVEVDTPKERVDLGGCLGSRK